ncbi:hypothetical protein R6Q59_005526 [Mikania micrantha]
MVKVVEHNSDIKIQGKRQGGVPVLEKKKTPLQMAKSGVEVYEHQTICSAHMVVKDGVSDQARSGSESDGENRIERTSDAGES